MELYDKIFEKLGYDPSQINTKKTILEQMEIIKEYLKTVLDVEQITGVEFPSEPTTLTYDTENGYRIFTRFRVLINDTPFDLPCKIIIPIKAGNEMSMDISEDNKTLVIKFDKKVDKQSTPDTIPLRSKDGLLKARAPLKTVSGVGSVVDYDKLDTNILLNKQAFDSLVYDYTITGVPTSAINGTFTQDVIYFLQNAPTAKITFNNEEYYRCDNEHTTGTLVFSHVGYEKDTPFIKTITITISSRSWVLTTITVPIKLKNYVFYLTDNDEIVFQAQVLLSLPSNEDYVQVLAGFTGNDTVPVTGFLKEASGKYSTVIGITDFEIQGARMTIQVIRSDGTLGTSTLQDFTTDIYSGW